MFIDGATPTGSNKTKSLFYIKHLIPSGILSNNKQFNNEQQNKIIKRRKSAVENARGSGGAETRHNYYGKKVKQKAIFL
ncbi:MAG: hypothetical protein IPI42_05585 [Saprospiraceae bacterium]|nr:hypothetical protein [Candidatus Parvibacillus calidus]